MPEQIIVRGKSLNVGFAKAVSKKRFCELYKEMKPEVIEAGWDELLEATGRTEKKPTKSEKRKKSS